MSNHLSRDSALATRSVGTEARTLKSPARAKHRRVHADVTPHIGRYELRALLGRGGMGSVYEAFDRALGREVAIKLLHETGESRYEQTARLFREASALARVSHPNVIRIYDVGFADGHGFAAMELVRGWTLAEWTARVPRTADEVIAAYVQAGRGLAAAHAAGLVHRDFKPDNVLVGLDGRVLLGDFGVAELRGGRGMYATRSSSTGEIVGTPEFMAPEQRSGEVVSARADQYSFCFALTQDLTAVVPTSAARTDAGARARLAGVRGALRRGLALRPSDRFASMDELLAVIERTTATSPCSASTRRERRRRSS